MEITQIARALFVLSGFIVRLKEEPRDGWNRYPRKVVGAESVADHSYGTTMLAMVLSMMAPHLGLNQARIMCLCSVHDLVEMKTRDINVHVIQDPIQKASLRAEKKRKELEAIGEIRSELGDPLGSFIFDLWMEYEDSQTREACIAHELDAIEAVLQALWYAQQGHQVDPRDFYTNARLRVTTPELVALMESQILPKLQLQ